MTETESTRILQASLSLAASLLEAADEPSALRAVMRAGCEVLGADGCLFMPFDEFAQKLTPLEFGRIPASDSERASQPSQRQKCKVCETRHAGRECALLQDDPDSNFIHCISMRARGREAGLFSFVFSSEPRLDESRENFLSEAMRLTELALDAFERNHFIRSMQYSSPPAALTEEARSLLPQIEYRAILGERTRLAREIHDGLAQTLAFLKIEIGRAESMLMQGKSEQAARILKDSSRTIGDAYLDARQAIENLRRAPDDHLATWLDQAAHDFEELAGLPVEVDLRLTRDFPDGVQAQLIRIVQEALTNIRKHAQANHIRLAAWEDGEDTLIEVADDGRGFRPADSVAAARFGLRGMRERAEAVGAEFQVTSCPSGGTTVRVRVPSCVGANS
ncbi:MAG: sensor histidine kinase [Anaerolineaceae bacterium]|nr:MAG: sensor histidine kinase [Anaerolineaceae bacterium]